MSRILSYSKFVNSISSMDGTTTLVQSLQLDSRREHKVRLIDFAISSQIPNVFNYNGTNNGLLAVSGDGGATYTDIQIEDGIYSVSQIQNAINQTLSSWWTDVGDPGILIRSNTAIKKNYIVLDSTKLKAPHTQLGIDLSLSSISDLLGFSATKTFIVDGTYTGDMYPQLDWIGNKLRVLIHGLGPITILDGGVSDEICRVNLATESVTNLYTFPDIVQPAITVSPPSQLNSFSVELIGSRNNRPVYLLEGEVFVSIEIIEM